MRDFSDPQNSGVNKSARERIGRHNLSQKVPSKKGSLGVIFSPRNYRENAHSKSANFEGRHSGGHLLGRPFVYFRKKKAQKFRGKVRSIFREKIHASKKIFRANFVLQTRHPKTPYLKKLLSSRHNPKGPFRTKHSTESKFTTARKNATAIAKRYG